MNIMAIDPGTTESAYVIADRETLKPVLFDKIENSSLLGDIAAMIDDNHVEAVGIELMQSYSMGVGKSTFETCYFIGRLQERIVQNTHIANIVPIYRSDEKMLTVGSMRANDHAMRLFLIDKFAKFDFKNGKGTKKNPDWFYGFAKDMWQAYAQAYVLKLKMEEKDKSVTPRLKPGH